MNKFNETTAQNLKAIRGQKGIRQEEIAALLGIPNNAVSKIEGGSRTLSDAEKTVLDWYFFGAVPPKIETIGTDPRTLLEFTEGEWMIIGVIAKRNGMTERQWISSRIRDYLDVIQLNAPNGLGEPESHLKVADQPHSYGQHQAAP